MTHALAADELERRLRAVRLVVFDFDGVFTDNTVLVGEDGSEYVRCWRGDGLGLRKLDRLGIHNMIMSTETNPVVGRRAAKLRIRCEQAVDDKRAALDAIMAELAVTPEQVAFVGNDINDLVCLRMVGVPIAVADAHPAVDDCIVYRTQARGGCGAVREVCDLLERLLDG